MSKRFKKIIERLAVLNVAFIIVFFMGAVFIAVIPLGETTTTPHINTAQSKTLTNETLIQFLVNDTTEDQYYCYQVHDCMDFSIELANNLTEAGYNVGIVEQQPMIRGIACGHVMTWVRFGNYTVYIEPQSDQIYTPEQYTNLFDTEKYELVEMPTINMVIKRTGYRTGYGVRKACMKYLLL